MKVSQNRHNNKTTVFHQYSGFLFPLCHIIVIIFLVKAFLHSAVFI